MIHLLEVVRTSEQLAISRRFSYLRFNLQLLQHRVREGMFGDPPCHSPFAGLEQSALQFVHSTQIFRTFISDDLLILAHLVSSFPKNFTAQSKRIWWADVGGAHMRILFFNCTAMLEFLARLLQTVF